VSGPVKPKQFRLPEHIDAYLKDTSRLEERSETEIVQYAIELDRDMSQGLADDTGRLRAAAVHLGVDYDRDLGRLLAMLTRRGLDAIEADAAKKHRK
jgi:hypothetical protein